jgi:hypothetical protein
MTEKIIFQKKRDFGDKLNASFEFIRQNFKSLITAIFKIVGIPLILLGVVGGVFYYYYAQFLLAPDFESELIGLFIIGGVVMFVVGLAFYALFMGTIYEYIKQYIDKGPGGVDITALGALVRKRLGYHVMTILGLVAIYVGLAFIPVLIVVLLAQQAEALAIVGALMMFVLVPGFIYLAISLSLFFVIRTQEDISIGEAFSRCFKLIKGKWWSTFGLLFVMGIIQAMAGWIIMIPYYILIFVMGFSGEAELLGDLENLSMVLIVVTIVFYALNLIVSLLGSMLSYIALAFQYYNLVEMKEATGLMQRLDTFGQGEQEDEEHY